MILEELIKELKEYFINGEISYNPEHKILYRTVSRTTRPIISVDKKGRLIQHYYALPPKLFIAIGKFYEGELNK